ncbi:TPA: helix-turn-helix transcriptional regulator, partial [Yersinia enterocolitica]|nr:helix-turn-helix transcriptional regulator [Yersinia enterocolitica]HEN3602488.1 helix-turn-helix transcriptional regulator [Yersinia enterocolitica]
MISVVSLSQSSFFGAGLDYIVSDVMSLRKSKHSISLNNFTDIADVCDYIEIHSVDFLIVDYTWPGESWLNMIISLKERMRYHHFKIVSIIGEKILEIEHIVIKQTSYLSFDLYNSIQGLHLVLSDSTTIKGRSNN